MVHCTYGVKFKTPKTNYLQQIFMSSAPNKGMAFQAEDMDFTPDN